MRPKHKTGLRALVEFAGWGPKQDVGSMPCMIHVLDCDLEPKTEILPSMYCRNPVEVPSMLIPSAFRVYFFVVFFATLVLEHWYLEFFLILHYLFD